MNYIEIIKFLKKQDYKEYIKAVIAMEWSIYDEKTLNIIYNEYMESDYIALLSEELYDLRDAIIDKESGENE